MATADAGRRAGPGHWRAQEHKALAATRSLRLAAFVALLLLVWISPEPFKTESIEFTTGGNIVNQLAFSGGAALGLMMLAFVDRRALGAFLRPTYLVLIAWLALGVVVSIQPDVSLRAFMFTTVVLVIAAMVLVLPVDEAQMANGLGIAMLCVLAVCWAGLVALPDIAMHSAGDISEPEHAGSWKGLFDHKNIAGPMMAFFAMTGLYVAGRASRPLGWSVFGLSVAFLVFTNAKTATALFPLVLLTALAAERIESRFWRAALCLGPLALLLLFTVGTVLLPPARALLDLVSPGQTFTGRTEIWGFVFDRLAARPLTGFGFEAFWGSDMVRFAEMGEGETGIAQGMVHGHNAYVDVAVTLGLPGLLLVVLALVVLPLRDYAAARAIPGNELLARLWLRIWLFAIYTACLESFFFRRADPVWFTLILAVLGLRLASLWRARRGAA